MSTKSENLTRAIVSAHRSDVRLSAYQLDHPEWIKAPAIHITRMWSGEEAPESRHAEARIIWSEESLVVRFVCRQSEPLIVNPHPQLDKKTIGLWNRDVCEIFVAPDRNTPDHYFEFEAAPTGEWVDLGIHLTSGGRETDWQFYSGMTTAARFAGERLDQEIDRASSQAPEDQIRIVAGEKQRGGALDDETCHVDFRIAGCRRNCYSEEYGFYLETG